MRKSRPKEGYGSAEDLPTVVELRQMISAFKILKCVLPEDKRSEISKIERRLDELTSLVDRFYELLGHRNWIYNDRFDPTRLQAIVSPGATPNEAEAQLIDYFQQPETLDRMIRRLNGLPEMRLRIDLIQKALVDYRAGRYYAVVLVLLTVMDGFVNNVTPSDRRGLHTRNSDELHAWNSVVGHHLGLGHAHQSFRKASFKTSQEQVTELHRHGLLHGNLINYDHVVVATKAWNRLFAIADWAEAEENRRQPEPRPPTLQDSIRQFRHTQELKDAIAAWTASELHASDEGFEDDRLVQVASGYLEAWMHGKFGAMAKRIPMNLAEATERQTAGRLRSDYELHPLDGFTVTKVSFVAPAVGEVEASFEIDGRSLPARMRWIHERNGEAAVKGTDGGEWYLYSFGPYAMLATSD